MIPADAIDKMKTAAVLLPGDGERINVIGDSQTIKLDGAMTNGLFALIEQNNTAGAGVPLHVHTREDETFYVCDGEVTFQVGEIEILAPGGTTVYLPRGVPHGFRVNKPTRALVSVHPAGAESMFRELSELPSGPPDMKRVTKICARYGIYFL
jgi:mannose-6-phosphate isomerase-like protein (cupin superfamily)